MKLENEITVKVSCGYEELTKVLLDKGFEITNEVMLTDIYLIKNEVDINGTTNEDILGDYLIVRIPDNNNAQITYKYKEYNPDRSIRKQGKINCDVMSSEKALDLLEHIGYKKLFVIKNEIKFYQRGNIRFVAAMVNDEYICLEYSGNDSQTIEDVIEDFEINFNYIPYEAGNYFINKAMIELDKIKRK